jgi:phosphoribosylformylglycinamidine (FGAM) synthase PurS component
LRSDFEEEDEEEEEEEVAKQALQNTYIHTSDWGMYIRT